MTKQQATERMCAIMALVADELHGYQYAADCFCGKTAPMMSYQNQGRAIEYIEMVVRAALDKEEHGS